MFNCNFFQTVVDDEDPPLIFPKICNKTTTPKYTNEITNTDLGYTFNPVESSE